MKMFFSSMLVFTLILTGCSSTVNEAKPASIPSAAATPTSTPKLSDLSSPDEKKDVIFTVSSFKITYEDKTRDKQLDERYNGEGIVTVNGTPEFVNKTYFVFVEIKKITGGDKNSYNDGIRTVIVNKGIGRFATSDWNFDEQNKMIKPIYEAKIIGYVTPDDYLSKAVQSN